VAYKIVNVILFTCLAAGQSALPAGTKLHSNSSNISHPGTTRRTSPHLGCRSFFGVYINMYIYIYICHIICWVQEGERGAERTRELKSIIGAWPRVTFGLKYYNYKRTPAGKARRKVNRSWSSGVEHWHRIASLAWLTTTLKQKSAA